MEEEKIKNKEKFKNTKQRGITLIALVITIIVLLILAGVSIAMLTGENGILTQAQNAKEETTKSEEEEKIKMAVMGSSINDDGFVEMIDETSFKNELKNQFGNQKLDVVVNGDGSFIITVEDTQRKYYVNDDKTVINSDNIIEISTEQQLKDFRDDVNAGNSYEGKAVLLIDDITLIDDWIPIGYISKDTDLSNPNTEVNKSFGGIFDGCNNTIDNLFITSTENRYNGLFSFVVDGTIRNVTIGENSNITGSSGAGIVGFFWGLKGNIYNCINYADTNFAGIVVMLAGQHTVSNCKNYGNITGSGGIVGSSNGHGGWAEAFENYSHKIINCGNYGNVTREDGDYCGGIAGYFNGEISNCCNKGEIRGNGRYTGGIAGNNEKKIKNCYNIKSITGKDNVGGILGSTESGFGKENIINCYSLGEIVGSGNKGQIVGIVPTEQPKAMKNCYTTDDIFTASDLGDAFVDNPENPNQPLLYWEEI